MCLFSTLYFGVAEDAVTVFGRQYASAGRVLIVASGSSLLAGVSELLWLLVSGRTNVDS